MSITSSLSGFVEKSDTRKSLAFRYFPSFPMMWMERSRPIVMGIGKDDVEAAKLAKNDERLWFVSSAKDIVEDTPMSFAMKTRAVGCVEHGLKAGWDISSGQTIWSSQNPGEILSGGNTLMHTLASVSDSQPLVFVGKTLIEKGSPFDKKNMHGVTPLHVAAAFGDAAMIELLMQNKARIDEVDDGGRTPLLLALSAGKHKNAEKLLFWNAAQDVVDAQGWDAGKHAVMSGDTMTVKVAVRTSLLAPSRWEELKKEASEEGVDEERWKRVSRWMKEFKI